jgi:hypothetical protein
LNGLVEEAAWILGNLGWAELRLSYDWFGDWFGDWLGDWLGPRGGTWGGFWGWGMGELFGGI